jgi:hypothetical protein
MMDLPTAGRALLADPANHAARAELESLLRTLAANLGEHELEQLLVETKDHPNFHTLVDALDQLSERTIVSGEGNGYEGVLLALPMVLESEKPIRDLPPAAVKKIVAGLHEHGLLGRSETAGMQRWISTSKGLLHNHVQRKRVLLGMMSESTVGRQPNPYRNTLPVELPTSGRDTEARFLTLSIQGPIGCFERAGLWGSPELRPRLQAWMAEVAKAMKSQGYRICSALLPCPYSLAGSKGALLAAQEQVRRFTENTIAKVVVPHTECTIHARFSPAADRRSLTLTLRYLHEGEELVRDAFEVKGLRGDDTIDVIVTMLTSHITREVEEEGFRNAEFVHDAVEPAS